MVNLPRPPAASIIEHQPYEAGVELSYTEKPLQNPTAWVALAVFVAFWIVGLVIPVNNMMSASGSPPAPAIIWIIGWGGIGIFFLQNFVRQRIVGRVQRLRFEDQRLVFLPKARLPRGGTVGRRSVSRPVSKDRPIPHSKPQRGPLRVSELDRQDLDAVEPGSRGGVDLVTRSGSIPLARTLSSTDIEYLTDVLNTWRDN